MSDGFESRDPLRLATNKQLWVLNQRGRLALVEGGRPVTSPEAFEALRVLLSPDDESEAA